MPSVFDCLDRDNRQIEDFEANDPIEALESNPFSTLPQDVSREGGRVTGHPVGGTAFKVGGHFLKTGSNRR